MSLSQRQMRLLRAGVGALLAVFVLGSAGVAGAVPGTGRGAAAGQDDNVEWDGLRHDSRDPLYRTPGGAVPAGTPVTLRLRTLHDDVTAVRLRVFDLEQDGQQLLPLFIAASDVDCYDAALADATCDYWAVTLPNVEPTNLWYRFIVTDGTDTDYYADNTPALDGGPGAVTDEQVDQSWALMVHTPGFAAPAWARNAVVYQIFPDRFRNGDPSNDPQTGDVRYDDPVIALEWGDLPEGYCRNYANAASVCPWRFDDTPPDSARPRKARAGALHGRRPARRDREARLPQGAGRQRPLLQPHLRRGLQPQLRHPGLQPDRPLLRHPGRLGRAGAAGRAAATAGTCTSAISGARRAGPSP